MRQVHPNVQVANQVPIQTVVVSGVTDTADRAHHHDLIAGQRQRGLFHQVDQVVFRDVEVACEAFVG